MDQQTSLFVSYDDTKTDSGAVTMDHLRHTLRIRHIDSRFDTPFITTRTQAYV